MAPLDDDNRQIIADRSATGARSILWGVGVAALAVGALAAVAYAQRDLTISHYDARAHLVVARRVFDSLTPGWRQIGAVWLPLPHLINLIPVQWDFNYRTGYLSVAISIAALSAGLGVMADYVRRRTGSPAAGLAAAALVMLNPNVLYLQSTPMTELLLFAVSCLGLAAVDRWIETPTPKALSRAGWLLAALTWTRYEGWPVAGALVLGAIAARGRPALSLAWWPAAAAITFVLLSWASTGQWFVSSGFFTPDNPSRHDIVAVVDDVITSTRELGGDVVFFGGVIGVLIAIVAARRDRRTLLPLALLTAATLPLAAFYQGHPHRVRYMLPLVVAADVMTAFAVARVPARLRGVVASAVVVAAIVGRPPFDMKAPMALEAQWETPNRIGRQAVTRYLATHHDGTPILASMGSLGHYMQESSSIGLHIADFLHEGNGDLWSAAVSHPLAYVRWILAEEQAEGGDVIAQRARRDPTYLNGFQLVAAGGGMSLYARLP